VEYFWKEGVEMKIWYQSSTPLDGDQVFEEYKQMIYDHSKAIIPNAHLDVYGVITSILEVEFKYFAYLNKREIIEKMIAAEYKGYDAICLGCFLDPGLQEARGIVDIPIASMGESSMLFACMLGKRFSIITYNEKLIPLYEDNIRLYGLENRAASMGVMKSDLEMLAGAFKNPKPIISSFIDASERAIDAGAEVVIPGCGLLDLVLVKNRIHSVGESGVPILDCVGVNLQAAQTMATLKEVSGITTSRKLYYAQPSRELLDKANELFNLPKEDR
jgi:Asp/Glu/hydantoin racemase